MPGPALSWPRPLRLAEQPDEAWRNGGGRTRTLAADPASENRVAPRWRLSVATVEVDGPFSTFPGLERYALLLDGPGLGLSGPEGERRLAPVDTPIRFPGEWPLQARTHGPGPNRVLNLMVQRDRMQGRLSPRPTRLDAAAPAGAWRLLLVAAGRLRLQATAGVPPLLLAADEALLLPAAVLAALGPLDLQAAAPASRWLLAAIDPIAPCPLDATRP